MSAVRTAAMAAVLGTCAILAAPATPHAFATAPADGVSLPACATTACPDGMASPNDPHTVTLTAGPNTIQGAPAMQDTSVPSGPSLSAPDITALLALLQQSVGPSGATPTPTQRIAGKTVSSARGATAGTTVTANASCDTGHVLYGGGGQVTTSDGRDLDRGMLTASYASSDNTWTVVGVVAGGPLDGSETLNVTATAICSA